MAAKKPKLNEIPLEDLNEEISARAGILASEMIMQPDNHVVRHPYSRRRVAVVNTEESMTHQSHAESCDINNIIRQFDRTGLLPPPKRPGQYGDVTALNKDLQELYLDMEEIGTRIREAQTALAEKQKAAEEAAHASSHAPGTRSPEAPPAQNAGSSIPPSPPTSGQQFNAG